MAAGGPAGCLFCRILAGQTPSKEVALAELDRQTKKIDDPDEMANLIAGVTADPELGNMFGEIFDIVGPGALASVARRPKVSVVWRENPLLTSTT